MIKVTCEVDTYVDDKYGKRLLVHADSIWSDRVHLEIGEEKLCVKARDLITAIENATRTNR